MEDNCFLVNTVKLEGADSLPDRIALKRITEQATGKCLGEAGIGLLIRKIQNRLVEGGYITSRVYAPPQNMKSGTLTFNIVAGRVRHVVLSENSDRYFSLYSTIPSHSGDLLNLRDIEQGLENIQRLPDVKTHVKIIPARIAGESDIELQRKQKKMWRVGVTVDDSATNSVGRYQAGLSLSLHNPFSLSDLVYISGSRDLNMSSNKGNKNLTAHYSVPVGYWSLGITGWNYDYHQTISGYSNDYLYSGKTKNLDVKIGRVLHRGQNHRTAFTYDILARESHYYLFDTEIALQHRRISAWRLGLQHRHYFGQATLDADVSFERGTRWFGALPAPEESSGSATALSKIGRATVNFNLPFKMFEQDYRYHFLYFRQTSSVPLTIHDQLSLGNRWTVRGFDGERTLIASRGWYVRNDFAWRTPLDVQELYLGMDYGRVLGAEASGLSGHHLAGGVLGLRGNAFNIDYDVFAGLPLLKPDGFTTSKLTLGFNMMFNY